MVERDEDFARMLEASFAQAPPRRRLTRGMRVRGTVVAVGASEVFVDVGDKQEAWVPKAEIAGEDGACTVAVGDTLEAVVAVPDDPSGPRLAVRIHGADRRSLELAREGGLPVRGRVTAAGPKGLEVDLGGTTAFCPAGNVELGRADDLAGYVGRILDFAVVEVRGRGRGAILSRRPILERKARERARARAAALKEGQEVEGTVEGLEAYGAFVDVGGVRGLLHASRLPHGARPSDLLRMGEPVRVRVERVVADPGGDVPRIDLAFVRALSEDEPAPIHSGTVAAADARGVTVATEGGEVFVPVRELDLPPGADPRRAYRPGSEVEVVLLGRDRKGRPRGSIRRVEEVRARLQYRAFQRGGGGGEGGGLGRLGDLLEQAALVPGPKARAPQTGASSETADAQKGHRPERRRKPK